MSVWAQTRRKIPSRYYFYSYLCKFYLGYRPFCSSVIQDQRLRAHLDLPARHVDQVTKDRGAWVLNDALARHQRISVPARPISKDTGYRLDIDWISTGYRDQD